MALNLIDVLQRGYFPVELPPPFSTNTLSLITTSISTTLSYANTQRRYSPPATHNLVRAGGLRRNLSIPNPKHFFKLANYMVDNWTKIELAASKSKYSLTKPITSLPTRAITPEFNLNERSEKVTQLRASGRYLLKTDISRFFPSIYSHCIPWALLGKQNAKILLANNTLSNTWQDKFDIYSRSINNNQTVGIPIGPDTSRVIAEIILGEIDEKLSKKFKKLRGIRFIDDYEFVFDNYNDAENVLSYLQLLLNEYELALNPNKTKIIKLPDLIEPIWTSTLRTFAFRDLSKVSQLHDIVAYFNTVFEFIKNSPDEGIMKYAIARLRSEKIDKDNWKMYENILANCALTEPACLPQVYEQLVYYSKEYSKCNKELWANVLNRIIYERVPLGQSSEAAWAMWILRFLNKKLSVKSTKVVANTDDSILGLMAIGLELLGLAEKSYLSNLALYSNSNYIYEPQWLFCYQTNVMNYYLPNARMTNLQNDQFYSYLLSNNISFFDINKTINIPIRDQKGRIKSNIAENEY